MNIIDSGFSQYLCESSFLQMFILWLVSLGLFIDFVNQDLELTDNCTSLLGLTNSKITLALI